MIEDLDSSLNDLNLEFMEKAKCSDNISKFGDYASNESIFSSDEMFSLAPEVSLMFVNLNQWFLNKSVIFFLI